MTKRIISMLLAIFMVVGLLPNTAFAAEGDNLCDHHTEHTADCGYAPAVEGSPCTHECGEECAEACTHVHDEACGYVEAVAEVPCGYVCEESHGEATRVIYVDESTFLASGYSRFFDANENLLTATREEQEDGWVKYTMPADAKYYLTFDGHLGGGGGGDYPELPTNADCYDPSSDTWSCSHPGYAEGACSLCGKPCPGHTYDNACDAECNVCSEIREVGDHVYDGAEDAECNECSYVRDITPVQITGVSITVDGVLYTEGNVTITPDSTVILTVTGTNLQSGSDDHRVDYAGGRYLPVTPDYFEISEDGTVATYETSAGDFANSSNFEITYCNNDTDTANRTVVSTGIYLTYDDGISEENRARITGMSITIDGVVYDSSNTSAEDPAVITPNTEFITITVHGTALQNCTVDHVVSYYSGSSEPILANNLWHFEADGTGAYHYYSSASALSDFARNTTPYELQYSNNGSFNAANPAIGSGVYIVYDDSTGGEEDPTPAEITGISITVDGETYTSGNVTITPTSTVTITITGTNLQNGTEDHRVDYTLGFGLWATPDYCDVSEDGTTATFAPSPGNFAGCSNYEIEYYNNYTDDINRAVVSSGIYLTYESGIAEEDAARITGVSITVDGETYTSGNVTITPTSTITFTVTGTNLQNGTEDNYLEYAFEKARPVTPLFVTISEDGTSATFVPYIEDFADCRNYEIVYYNNYTDVGNRVMMNTGIYLTYESGIAEEDQARITGVSITVDGVTYTSGDVTITPTSTVTLIVTGTNLQNATRDHTVAYASGLSGHVRREAFEISEDGTTATTTLPATDFVNSSHYEMQYYNNFIDTDNRTAVPTGIYLTYDDGSGDDNTGGEEDTTPAEITGVSITVDGVTYTEGDVTITPDTQSIIVTVTGTHFANLSGDYVLDLGPGLTVFMNSFRWETDPAANTATADFSDLNPEFGDHNRSEIMYSNGGGQGLTGTGIYLTYDDGTGGEEDTTLDSTGKILVDMQDSYGDGWNGAAIDIYKNGSLEQTVTVDETSNTVFLDYDSTATYEFKWIKGGYDYECSFTIYEDGEEKLSVTDASVYENGETIWPQGDTGGEEDTTSAEITGVTVTVDGVPYTSGNVTITPTSTVIFTVTGTNFANLSADNIVSSASGSINPLHNGGWTIDTETNTATRNFSDPISRFDDCDNYEVRYSNDGDVGSAYVGTGIYLTYDDSTGGEEDTTPAEITGVSITVDGVTYTEGDVTITPDTQSIIVTVTGTHFANLSADNILELGPGLTIFMNTWRWEVDSAANTATADFSDLNSEFGDHNGTEIMYSNGGGQGLTGTGIYLTYDSGIAEEDKAEITGVSITVDGETYTSGNVTITPTSTVTLTVTGTNLLSGTDDNCVVYAFGCGDSVTDDWFTISDDGTTATREMRASDFSGSQNFEIFYYNNYTDAGNRIPVSTGIYLTYDDSTGGEEDTTSAQITGVTVTVDGVPYTSGNVTITPTSTIIYTVTGTNFANLNDDNIVSYALGSIDTLYNSGWTIDTETNTATRDFSGSISWFDDCDNYEVRYSNDGDVGSAYVGTGIYLTYDDSTGGEEDTTPAEITGVSITVDGVTYTEGDVTITPDTQSIIVTVTGTHFANLSGDYVLDLGPGLTVFMNSFRWEVDSDANTATADFSDLNPEFGDHNGSEIMYSNDSNQNWTGTGIYLTYDDGSGGEEDTTPAQITGVSITIDGEEYVGSDTSAENPALITSEAASVILTVHGTNLQNATSDYLIVFGPAGNSIGLGGAQWTMSEDGSWASYDMTWLVEEFTESLPTWEIKYSTNGEDLEDAVTALYVKYEHIAAEEEPLVITQQPTDAEARLGERYCVEVIAQGEGLTYQWYFRNEGSTAWYKSSVTDNTYDDVMTKARMGREVYCVITDSQGNTVTTETAVLKAIKTADLAITAQPNNASAKLGERFCVTVEAVGDELKYQWYWRQIGSETWNVSGVRDNTYDDVMTRARHNREVYCVITDAWGDSVTTEVATITGTPTTTLAITRQPESQSVYLGDMFNVNFEAQGDGLEYQWYFRRVGTEVWHTSSQRDNSYDDVMTGARHNRELYCVVTDAWGNTLETSPVVVIMAIPRHELAITAQPENEAVKMGEMFCVTVEAQGDELKYQWYWRNVGSETWNVSGQRDNTYDDVMTAARHNREVKCVITDMWGERAETEIATITAIPDQTLAILSQPTDATAAMGENYCAAVEAQGDGLTYQWYFKNAGSEIWHKSGVRDNTYDDVMTAARAGRQVYCVITDIWGNTVTTDTVTLICAEGSQMMTAT